MSQKLAWMPLSARSKAEGKHVKQAILPKPVSRIAKTSLPKRNASMHWNCSFLWKGIPIEQRIPQ